MILGNSNIFENNLMVALLQRFTEQVLNHDLLKSVQQMCFNLEISGKSFAHNVMFKHEMSQCEKAVVQEQYEEI